MHRTAEYGIAAHWRYKEGGKSDSFENKLAWLRSLLEWQNDARDSRVFMENLKLDLFENQVFLFSPKGDVFSLPNAATPLDFAYHVHTDVGNRCIGAKVNGKIVPLDCQLKNGDICEILTQKLRAPHLTGSASSVPRARSTRSNSGSAKNARKRTSWPARKRSKRSWCGRTFAPTRHAANRSNVSRTR